MDVLLSKIKGNDFLCVSCFGLNFCSIQIILNEVEELFEKYKRKQGRHRKLEPLFCILLYLYFLKNYCSIEKLRLMFGVSTSTAWRYVKFMTFVFENLECLNNIHIHYNINAINYAIYTILTRHISDSKYTTIITIKRTYQH